MANINYSTELVKSIKEEFEVYKRAEIIQSAEKVFDNSHKNYFYTEMCSYFNNMEYLDDVSEALYKDSGNILYFLYEFYQDNEYESVSSSEAIDELIERYVEKHHENTME